MGWKDRQGTSTTHIVACLEKGVAKNKEHFRYI